MPEPTLNPSYSACQDCDAMFQTEPLSIPSPRLSGDDDASGKEDSMNMLAATDVTGSALRKAFVLALLKHLSEVQRDQK